MDSSSKHKTDGRIQDRDITWLRKALRDSRASSGTVTLPLDHGSRLQGYAVAVFNRSQLARERGLEVRLSGNPKDVGVGWLIGNNPEFRISEPGYDGLKIKTQDVTVRLSYAGESGYHVTCQGELPEGVPRKLTGANFDA